MKLGNGNIKYKIKFIYELTNRISYKFVYANSEEEALKLFNEEYKNCIDVRILSIKIFDIISMNARPVCKDCKERIFCAGECEKTI